MCKVMTVTVVRRCVRISNHNIICIVTTEPRGSTYGKHKMEGNLPKRKAVINVRIMLKMSDVNRIQSSCLVTNDFLLNPVSRGWTITMSLARDNNMY